jgi:hypothetical protein
LIVEPIVVVDRLPGGRATGGGWFAARSASTWLSSGGVRNTGVDAETMRARIEEGGNTGVVGITCAAFLRSENWGGGHWACEFTLLHEVGHSVDHHAGLIPRGPVEGRYGNAPFQGMRYPGGSVGELAAEAYSRFFLRASSMCRGGEGTPACITPAGIASSGACPNQARCSGRLQRDLRAAPAFATAGVVFPLAAVDAEPSDSRHAAVRRPTPHTRQAIDGISPPCAWSRRGPTGVGEYDPSEPPSYVTSVYGDDGCGDDTS